MSQAKFVSTNQKHHSDLGSDASSVWNFCSRCSDVILRGNQWGGGGGGVRNVGCFISLKTDEDSTSLVMAFRARVIEEVYIFQGSAINAAAFHPDGRSIALGFKKGG